MYVCGDNLLLTVFLIKVSEGDTTRRVLCCSIFVDHNAQKVTFDVFRNGIRAIMISFVSVIICVKFFGINNQRFDEVILRLSHKHSIREMKKIDYIILSGIFVLLRSMTFRVLG